MKNWLLPTGNMQSKKIEIVKNIGMIALLIAIIMGSIMAYRRENCIKPNEYEKDPMLRVLFSNGKPIGQSFSRFQPEKRMVRVRSYQEAYEIFLSMCPDKEKIITVVREATHICYLYPLCNKNGYLCFTDKVESDTYEVAVVWVISDSIGKMGVREVHFVETIKNNPHK